MHRTTEPSVARPWYLDAVAALAFFVLGLGMGKGVGRTLGIFGGLFFLAFTLGLGYWFGRTAWNALMRARRRRDR